MSEQIETEASGLHLGRFSTFDDLHQWHIRLFALLFGSDRTAANSRAPTVKGSVI